MTPLELQDYYSVPRTDAERQTYRRNHRVWLEEYKARGATPAELDRLHKQYLAVMNIQEEKESTPIP